MTDDARAPLDIAVLPGDGIGLEITKPAVDILHHALALAGAPTIRPRWGEAGATTFRRHGVALPDETLRDARAADAIWLAAMGDPAVRYEDGTEVVPQVELRFRLDLYAGVRPVRTIPAIGSALKDDRPLDFVLVRESTEGLFALAREGTVTREEARDTQVITRRGTERLARFGFELARRRAGRLERPGHVTCVDKANIFRSFAFMREVFDAVATDYGDVAARHGYVDAVALDMVRRPWSFDVLVTENMFGDILSDLGAGLVGGLGFAPSADIGDDHAVFQPCHGTAPDIAGRGLANPTAMILSGAMMLSWLAERRGDASLERAAALVERAVDAAFAGGLVSTERGGGDGTAAIAGAVAKALDRVDVPDPTGA